MEASLSRARSVSCLGIVLVGLSLVAIQPAQALITPAVTIDGPSSAIIDFGEVAMASDGTGGLVYVKSVAGTTHVFASRFVRGSWSAPLQVDVGLPYEGSQPAIAASPRGELLAVWVAPVATVHGSLRFGLYSARLPAGGGAFGPPILIDPNVGDGNGVAPSLAGTSPGKAIVAYRVITYTFPVPPPTLNTAVQLRPGDVMADIRLARLNADRWARLGTVNRNGEASMRPPTASNGPQIGIGVTGGAVVAWQEPDQTGAARIWMRRVFGNTPGVVLEASPSSWEGKPVSADADAFSLAVTPYAMARTAFRIGGGGGALNGRMLINTLPPNFAITAGKMAGPELSDGGPVARGVGPAGIAIAEDSERDPSTRMAFLAGSNLRQMGGDGDGTLGAVASGAVPRAQAGAMPVVAADPSGGGIVAYPALGATGLPLVAVRQDFASGAAQLGLLSGAEGGPVAGLGIGRSGAGDALIGFRQGEVGRFEIVAARVAVPPGSFKLKAPKGWVKPRAAKLTWQAANSAVGGVTYAVSVDGRTLKRSLRRRTFRVGAAQLGNGVVRAQVLAADRLGQRRLSRAVKLRVDGQPPVAKVRLRRGVGAVRLLDADSGILAKVTDVSFGDGVRDQGGTRFIHAYEARGRYRIRVRARDRAGNRIVRSFWVRVP